MPNTNLPDFGNSATGGAPSKDKAVGGGQKISDRLDESRDRMADNLRSGAQALHDKADDLPSGEPIANAAHKAASTVEDAADTVRKTGMREVLAHAQELVKRNPLPALLVATGFGFLIARLFSRD